MNELYPIRLFEHWMRYWWLPVIACLMGGLVGYGFHLTHPPVYEATATFYGSLDITKFGQVRPTQWDEDMALEQIKVGLWSGETIQAITSAVQAQQLNLDVNSIYKNAIIEREDALWQVRYRNPDPQAAQKMVNIWAQEGYSVLKTWQASGRIQPYVIIDPPNLASVPQEPILYGRYKLILAGGFIGLLIGLALIGLLINRIIIFLPSYSHQTGQ